VLAIDLQHMRHAVQRGNPQSTQAKRVRKMGDGKVRTLLGDGQIMYSRFLLAADREERLITTIEGLAENGGLDPLM
jgi:aerobic-type carbon monoxide dehydrogenase small subunit (CoxS/CutS family)